MLNDILPDWERVLASAAHLQRILPDAVLVGGSASAVYAEHRLSTDADHVLTDLRQRFDRVLAELESVAGWKTARVTRPVQTLGSLDGIETGVRQLIRDEPLAQPLPYDLEEHNLAEYKNLDPRWCNWQTVKAVCVDYAVLIFDKIIGLED